MRNTTKAFTLVELIVVVTILAILATIGFVSYSGYLAGTRDTSRISQLKSMSNALELYRTRNSLPLPNDYVEVTASGELIGYQGYIGKGVLETIEYTTEGKDPKDGNYFSYYLTKDRKYFQLMTFLEEEENTKIGLLDKNKSLAVDYAIRYPYVLGKKLGILTDENNTPIQEVISIKSAGYLDIKNTTDTYIARISNDSNENIKGSGSVLNVLVGLNSIGGKIFSSCKSLLNNNPQFKGKDGLYIIRPDSGSSFLVYCNMTINGGGWILIARSVSGALNGDFGWNYTSGSPNNNFIPYSMGEKSKRLNFSQIMLARYDIEKNIELAVTVEVDDNVVKNNVNLSVSLNNSCKVVYDDGIPDQEKAYNHCMPFQFWGYITKNGNYYFRPTDENVSWHGLMIRVFDTYGYGSYRGSFHYKPGMLFVR